MAIPDMLETIMVSEAQALAVLGAILTLFPL
jgi:hypothetical protein